MNTKPIYIVPMLLVASFSLVLPLPAASAGPQEECEELMDDLGLWVELITSGDEGQVLQLVDCALLAGIPPDHTGVRVTKGTCYWPCDDPQIPQKKPDFGVVLIPSQNVYVPPTTTPGVAVTAYLVSCYIPSPIGGRVLTFQANVEWACPIGDLDCTQAICGALVEREVPAQTIGPVEEATPDVREVVLNDLDPIAIPLPDLCSATMDVDVHWIKVIDDAPIIVPC